MARPARWRIIVLLALVLLPASLSQAAEEISTEKEMLKTKGGIRFNLPEDWPIEKKGAALGPIPVEEYVSRKLEIMEKRVAALEGKISSLEKKVHSIEEEQKKADRLRSKETPAL